MAGSADSSPARRCGALGVDGVAPPGARDRHLDRRPRRSPPSVAIGPGAVEHDVDVHLAALGVDPQRGERAEVGPRPVGVQELVAVPLGQHQLAVVGEQHPDAGGRLARLEADELGPGTVTRWSRGVRDVVATTSARRSGGGGRRTRIVVVHRPQSGGGHARLAPMADLNVLGGDLEPCGTDPMTGFYRDGCCSTGPEDLGSHTICAVVTAEFLEHQRSIGNDLSTPMPQYRFPGLVPGRPLVRHRRQLAARPRGRLRRPGGARLDPPARARRRAARCPAGPRRRRARRPERPGRVAGGARRPHEHRPPVFVRLAGARTT